MVYVLENITDYAGIATSLIGNKCLSKEEITTLDENKLRLIEYEDILNYVCTCDKLNTINESVIFYLDKLQNVIFNFDSNKINNYIEVRFPDYLSETSKGIHEDGNNYAQFLRIKLFMTNNLSVEHDNISYSSILNLNNNVQDNTMFLVKPNNENSELLNCFEDMTFLKETKVDQNMHDNTLNYMSASSKYVTDFAESVDINTSITCSKFKVSYDTVCSMWFVLHFRNILTESIIPILEQSLQNNNYYFLEYVLGYSYTHHPYDDEILSKCVKYLNKLNPFYSAGYSKADPTFFDYLHEVALSNNCITPEFISFISIRKLMTLLNDNTIDNEIFEKLFKSTYKNLHIKHKLCLMVYAAKMSPLKKSILRNNIIYPLIHGLDYAENMLNELPTLPLGNFFDYTNLRKEVPSNTDKTFQWVCSKNTRIIATILTGESQGLREIIRKDYNGNFKI